MTNTANFLSFLDELDATVQPVVKSAMRSVELAAGTRVVTEGEHSDNFYLLQEGTVEIFFSDDQGEKFTLVTLGPGSHFGELSLFDGEERSASVDTVTKCSFLVLERKDFFRVLGKQPELYEILLRNLAKIIRQQNDALRDMVLVDGYRKLSRFLNKTRIEMGVSRKAPARITAAFVANEIDVSVEVVLRLLSQLQSRKFLKLQEGLITLNCVLPDSLNDKDEIPATTMDS
ncbi:MAG: Crp/Fnr family transcriptional regulator [Oceanococcus sp.]